MLEANKSKVSGVGVESNYPATKFPAESSHYPSPSNLPTSAIIPTNSDALKNRQKCGDKRLEVVATISSIQQVSPTVKVFSFDLGGVDLPFLPGQWVDLFIDTGASVEVGGYSITSTALQRGSIELAVKRLDHGAAAAYLHDRARLGDVVQIQGPSGGFHHEPEWQGPLVLVAGGIGITPLISILRYVDQSQLGNPLALIYSASSPSELLFQDEILSIAARNSAIRCAFTVSRPSETSWDGRVGRIDVDMLREHTPGQHCLYYLCGPPSFQDDMAALVADMGIDDSMVRAERWW